MQKLSDVVADKIADAGIRQVFMVTGGGAMHLNHSLGRHPRLRCMFPHHEQACAIAAESYYRLSGRLAVVNVTTGPGGTNALTGVYGAWTDSIGMLVVSGQVKWSTTVRSTGLPLRQLGDQEVDIVEIVRPVTKYAASVTEPESIGYHLEKALYLARTGRPGPCWIDIPMNVQSSLVDPSTLRSFSPAELSEPWKATDVDGLTQTLLDRLSTAKRPVILLGTGVRASGCVELCRAVVEQLGIPVVTAWNAHDLIADEHPLYAGRPGTVGTRAGNFAVQNADWLLILGCRLNIRQVSYGWETFAREAYKVWVDIDASELKKPTVTPDLPIHADLADFLPALSRALQGWPRPRVSGWLDWCRERVRRYPVVLESYESSRPVNPYLFARALSECLNDDDIVVTGDGTACVVTFQAAVIKAGQRLYTNSGCAAMGYDLPAAIGAAAAVPGQRIVCLAGDGSIMMNLQELQTIAGNRLPIVIFLLNNGGYASIAQTHRAYFQGIEVGCTPESGVSFPSFAALCQGFGLPYERIDSHTALSERIQGVLASASPRVCEVFLDPEQPFAPKLASRQLPDGRMVSSPLEDMAPFLDRDELRENMLIPLTEE